MVNAMTTQKNEVLNNEDQALINDLFNEMGFDEMMLDGEVDISAAIEAAEPSAEAIEPSVEAAEVEVEAAAEPVAEAVEPSAEAVTVEAVEAAAEPSVDDVLGDLGLDGIDFGAVDTEVETEKKAIAPKLDDKDKSEKKVKPKASSGGNRVTYYNSSKSTVLLDRLGGNKDLIILEAGDLELPKEELQAKRQHLLDVLNNQPTAVNKDTGETVQKKVAEKVIQLFTYLNRGGALNRYTYIAFETLLKDGFLNTKKNGNLYQAYIANGYKDGTARAQSGQMSQLFPLLKIAENAQGHLVPNDQSIILAKMSAEIQGEQKAA